MPKASNSGQQREWVSTIHAAVSLGCSVQTLYRWTNTKGFPDSAVKRDRWGNLYDISAVREWAVSRNPQQRGRPRLQVLSV